MDIKFIYTHSKNFSIKQELYIFFKFNLFFIFSTVDVPYLSKRS